MRAGDLAQIFAGAVAPGVYRFAAQIPPAVAAAAAEKYGWRFFYIDGRTVFDKSTFLATAAQAFGFPLYFGHNWDAFEEMVNDLSWAPGAGYLLLYDDVANFATNAPDEWAVALDILHHAVATWRAQGLPLIVLLRRLGREATALSSL